MADASVYLLLNVDFKDIIGIEKYSSVFYGSRTDGAVDRNNSEGRGAPSRPWGRYATAISTSERGTVSNNTYNPVVSFG